MNYQHCLVQSDLFLIFLIFRMQESLLHRFYTSFALIRHFKGMCLSLPNLNDIFKYDDLGTIIILWNKCFKWNNHIPIRGHRVHGRIVVGFTTTCAISDYHNWCYEFESRSGRGVQHYVIKFVSDLWQVSGFLFSQGPPVSSTNKTDRHDITEIL
jgi:hypothetical protein